MSKGEYMKDQMGSVNREMETLWKNQKEMESKTL